MGRDESLRAGGGEGGGQRGKRSRGSSRSPVSEMGAGVLGGGRKAMLEEVQGAEYTEQPFAKNRFMVWGFRVSYRIWC